MQREDGVRTYIKRRATITRKPSFMPSWTIYNLDGKSLNGNVVVSAIFIDVNVMFSLSNISI